MGKLRTALVAGLAAAAMCLGAGVASAAFGDTEDPPSCDTSGAFSWSCGEPPPPPPPSGR
ncbi:MAG TPA: hypothetical protein VM677_33805 [Actinokineospora sp.]|jgi:hypothetical protein|nr:hypothetical protein [Actinokineospora sp.]